MRKSLKRAPRTAGVPFMYEYTVRENKKHKKDSTEREDE
jgi:hypothetical protein